MLAGTLARFHMRTVCCRLAADCTTHTPNTTHTCAGKHVCAHERIRRRVGWSSATLAQADCEKLCAHSGHAVLPIFIDCSNAQIFASCAILQPQATLSGKVCVCVSVPASQPRFTSGLQGLSVHLTHRRASYSTTNTCAADRQPTRVGEVGLGTEKSGLAVLSKPHR